MKPTIQPERKKTSLKKNAVRNPKGRGAEKFKIEMSFGDVINKLIPSKNK